MLEDKLPDFEQDQIDPDKEFFDQVISVEKGLTFLRSFPTRPHSTSVTDLVEALDTEVLQGKTHEKMRMVLNAFQTSAGDIDIRAFLVEADETGKNLKTEDPEAILYTTLNTSLNVFFPNRTEPDQS